jgi:hypothetical protein
MKIMNENDNADKFDQLIQKIQYYATKIVDDIKKAANIFRQSGINWGPIYIPKIYDERADDLFFEWYVTDYINYFDDNHPKDAGIELKYGRNDAYVYVSYGWFNSYDLDNYGDDEAYLYEFVESLDYTDDLWYVTSEYGFTLEDLATDPYKVFEHFDEKDRLYYAEEVLAEFDMFTLSDRRYDLAKDASGTVKLYQEVENYFSYNTAEQALKDFYYDEDENETE